eukprot:TRINITY_DN1649_c0_g1_i1.p1 TRINITY_DN1649_c0_g1~~TRINITY_DN1649_c0_g1_i1.p1  ORF type:complete len:156 (+),score=41.34 TRINITY_DN1649_c0_g1_i1:491-958(+)
MDSCVGMGHVQFVSLGTTDESEFSEFDVEDSSSSLASSFSSDSLSSDAGGPLFELASLKASLPSKRGLSKHYGGKSQSFASLKDVRCLDDLAKPENPYRKRMKSCGSYVTRPASDPPQYSCGSYSATPLSTGNSSHLKRKAFIHKNRPAFSLKNT